jgi:predicted acyl esterase
MRSNLPAPLALVLAALVALVLPAAASAAKVPEGAVWTEATIPSTNGVKLHADILRPKQAVENGEKTPVILSIGPYFNYSGQVGPVGPAIGAPYDPVGPTEGPSDRFYDLVEGAKLMERGYTFVMVDLRGFGGSTGCLDWGGAGEQADVVAAVEWAATQEWSNGKVGMYGKSYDAVTGLIGVNKQPEGLAAVVAQQPVYDLYRYLYGDGLRRFNSVATPALYDLIDATPGTATDTAERPEYQINGANDTERPGCKAANWFDQAGNDDHDSNYWRLRNLIPGAKGSDVPLFLTAGLPENNTVSDGLAQYMENHTGYERAWLGPWNHVRGNERDKDGNVIMGREGFFDEVMRFYDRFLKGVEPDVQDPPVAVQTYDGKWRAEEVWPPTDAVRYTSQLTGGEYFDDGYGFTWSSDAKPGVWTFSKPLAHDAHMVGSPRATVDVDSPKNGNLVVSLYDVDPNGKATLLTRQGHLLRTSGAYTLDLWSLDYKVPAGHRIGLRVADADLNWWLMQTGTYRTVTVNSVGVELPFLAYERTGTIAGEPSLNLPGFKNRTVTLSQQTITDGESDAFVLPPKQQPQAASNGAKGAKKKKKDR